MRAHTQTHTHTHIDVRGVMAGTYQGKEQGYCVINAAHVIGKLVDFLCKEHSLEDFLGKVIREGVRPHRALRVCRGLELDHCPAAGKDQCVSSLTHHDMKLWCVSVTFELATLELVLRTGDDIGGAASCWRAAGRSHVHVWKGALVDWASPTLYLFLRYGR